MDHWQDAYVYWTGEPEVDPEAAAYLKKRFADAQFFTAEIYPDPRPDTPVLWTWRRMLERTREIWRRE